MKVRSNPVQGTHSVRSIMPTVSRTLIDKIAPPEPMARRKPRDFSGPKPRRNHATKIPDQVVLEIMRFCEFSEMSNRQIADDLADRGVEVTTGYVRSVRSGQIRGGLSPENGPPYI